MCWNDEGGWVEPRCSSTLGPGIDGTLLLDAVLADALVIDDDQVMATGEQVDDPLVAAAVEEATGRRRPL